MNKENEFKTNPLKFRRFLPEGPFESLYHEKENAHFPIIAKIMIINTLIYIFEAKKICQ